MDTTTPAVSLLRQRMIEDMRMRKLETKTQQAYIRAVLKLSAYLKRSPDTATAEDLRNFQHASCVLAGGLSAHTPCALSTSARSTSTCCVCLTS